MSQLDHPTFATEFTALDGITLPSASVIIGSTTAEPRSRIVKEAALERDIRWIELTEQPGGRGRMTDAANRVIEVSLRNQAQVAEAVSELNASRVVVDTTGLTHSLWGAVLRSCWMNRIQCSLAYVEPAEYRFSNVPTEGSPFDLSLSIGGVAPLPGFSRIVPLPTRPVIVPLLGFEGARLAHVLGEVSTPSLAVIPIIGIPGFRIEYPLFAFVGNRSFLEQGQYSGLRFARANDPFALFWALESIANEYPDSSLVVAPIGTKPHAIGALLFCLSSEDSRPVEIAYDHPNRSPRRTKGKSRVVLYQVTEFQEYLATVEKGDVYGPSD